MSETVFTKADADLLARVRVGDPRAEEAALRRWEPFVLYLVRRHLAVNQDLCPDDLLQAGRLGLWRATRSWSPSRSAFSTYMHCCITRALVRETTLQRRRLSDCVGERVEVLSLDAPVETGSDGATGDRIADILPADVDVSGEVLWSRAVTWLHRWALDVLAGNPAQLRAVVLRYGLDGGGERGYREMADQLNCTPMGAHYTVRNALQRLARAAQDPAVRAMWER